MNTRPFAASVVLAVSSFVLVGTASPALAVCDAYSGNCPTQPPGGGGSGGASGGGGTVSGPSTLPFTGGELIMLSTVAIGALAGGTALVVAGRRRGAPPA